MLSLLCRVFASNSSVQNLIDTVLYKFSCNMQTLKSNDDRLLPGIRSCKQCGRPSHVKIDAERRQRKGKNGIAFLGLVSALTLFKDQCTCSQDDHSLNACLLCLLLPALANLCQVITAGLTALLESLRLTGSVVSCMVSAYSSRRLCSIA